MPLQFRYHANKPVKLWHRTFGGCEVERYFMDRNPKDLFFEIMLWGSHEIALTGLLSWDF